MRAKLTTETTTHLSHDHEMPHNQATGPDNGQMTEVKVPRVSVEVSE